MIRLNETTKSLCMQVKVQQTHQEWTGVTLKRTGNFNKRRGRSLAQKLHIEAPTSDQKNEQVTTLDPVTEETTARVTRQLEFMCKCLHFSRYFDAIRSEASEEVPGMTEWSNKMLISIVEGRKNWGQNKKKKKKQIINMT